MQENCIFCKMGSGEMSGDFVYRDDEVFIIRDIRPRAPVHLLVIPTRHLQVITDLGEDNQSVVWAMFRAAREAVQQEGVAESGYRQIMNCGQDGGQEIPHLHMHIMGDTRLRGLGLR